MGTNSEVIVDLDSDNETSDPAERGQPERCDCIAIGVLKFEAAESQDYCNSGEPPQTPEGPELQDTVDNDLDRNNHGDDHCDDAEHFPS